MRILSWIFLIIIFQGRALGQDSCMRYFPVRAFAIAAPSRANLDSFIVFINKGLVPRGINVLVLRVDYHYRFRSHPELADSNSLTDADVKKIVRACQSGSISIIPQINLLGHQSWASETGSLLKVYPEFDETPLG